jgi:hypothetical protein
LASFPNVYPYKGVVYHTCDIFFTVNTGVPITLNVDRSESDAAVFIKPEDINFDDLAFDSTRAALKAFLETTHH